MMKACFISCQLTDHKFKTKLEEAIVFLFNKLAFELLFLYFKWPGFSK